MVRFYRSIPMTILTASKARAKFYRLIDEAAVTHEPIMITSRRANAVLISQADWQALQETLYLESIPGMRESIKKGLKVPLGKCRKVLKW